MTYVEVTTQKKTYTIPEWMWEIIEDLSDFDADFILETVEQGKILQTIDQAVFS